MYEDRPDPPLFMTAPDAAESLGQLSMVKSERLPSVDIERLPPVETEVLVDFSLETAASGKSSVLLLSDLIFESEHRLANETEVLPEDSLDIVDDMVADTLDLAEKRNSDMQAIDISGSSANGVPADVGKTIPLADIELRPDVTDIETVGQGQSSERRPVGRDSANRIFRGQRMERWRPDVRLSTSRQSVGAKRINAQRGAPF